MVNVFRIKKEIFLILSRAMKIMEILLGERVERLYLHSGAQLWYGILRQMQLALVNSMWTTCPFMYLDVTCWFVKLIKCKIFLHVYLLSLLFGSVGMTWCVREAPVVDLMGIQQLFVYKSLVLKSYFEALTLDYHSDSHTTKTHGPLKCYGFSHFNTYFFLSILLSMLLATFPS